MTEEKYVTQGLIIGSQSLRERALSYIDVLKPRETSLITFIGTFSAIVAGEGFPSPERCALAALAIFLGSGGTNGLTNYLDRGFDALMVRTRDRALPSKRIHPPEKVLPLTIGMVIVALALAWWLHPWAALGGLVGVIAAMIARGTTWSHFLGGISSVSPVLVGWLAINPRFSPALLLLCLLVFIWVPLHVWSVILAWRQDHLNAGLRVFPATWEPRDAVKVLFALSFVLYLTSLALYFLGRFGTIYLVIANILGLGVVVAGYRLWRSKIIWDAWLVYKLSAYPYLGLTFLALALDLWL